MKITIRDNRSGFAWFSTKLLHSFGRSVGFTAWGIYTTLCCYAGNENQRCHLSEARLAVTWGVTKRTVKRAIRKLKAFGLIRVKITGRASIYTLTNPLPHKRRGDKNVPSEVTQLTLPRGHQRPTELDFSNKTSLKPPAPAETPSKGKRKATLKREGEIEKEIQDLTSKGVRLTRERGYKHPEVKQVSTEIEKLKRELFRLRGSASANY